MTSNFTSSAPPLSAHVRSRCRTSPRGRGALPTVLFNYGLQRIGRAQPATKGTDAGPFVTPQELADMLGVNRTAVLAWVHCGKIFPASKDPDTGRALFRLSDIFVIARNAIRDGLSNHLLAIGRYGHKPGKNRPQGRPQSRTYLNKHD